MVEDLRWSYKEAAIKKRLCLDYSDVLNITQSG